MRDVQRLHADARVTATTVQVHPGHAAVREVATSGEPVVVPPRAVPQQSRAEGSVRRPGGVSRRGGQGRGRRPGPSEGRRPAP
jgi:hypothetical protein